MILPKFHTELFPLKFSVCNLPGNISEWCCSHNRGTYEDLRSGSLETKTQTSFSMYLLSLCHFLYFGINNVKKKDIKFTHFKEFSIKSDTYKLHYSVKYYMQ